MEQETLYQRLGGYDNIAAVANELLSRLMKDSLLGRFWENRGDDGIQREKQLLIDFLCDSTGGPLKYVGRDMLTTHKGMGISQQDWDNFILHLKGTFEHFKVPEQETNEVLGFIDNMKCEIVER